MAFQNKPGKNPEEPDKGVKDVKSDEKFKEIVLDVTKDVLIGFYNQSVSNGIEFNLP